MEVEKERLCKRGPSRRGKNENTSQRLQRLLQLKSRSRLLFCTVAYQSHLCLLVLRLPQQSPSTSQPPPSYHTPTVYHPPVIILLKPHTITRFYHTGGALHVALLTVYHHGNKIVFSPKNVIGSVSYIVKYGTTS